METNNGWRILTLLQNNSRPLIKLLVNSNPIGCKWV